MGWRRGRSPGSRGRKGNEPQRCDLRRSNRAHRGKRVREGGQGANKVRSRHWARSESLPGRRVSPPNSVAAKASIHASAGAASHESYTYTGLAVTEISRPGPPCPSPANTFGPARTQPTRCLSCSTLNALLDEHRSRQREVRKGDKGDKVLGIQRHLFGFDWLKIVNFLSFKMDSSFQSSVVFSLAIFKASFSNITNSVAFSLAGFVS